MNLYMLCASEREYLELLGLGNPNENVSIVKRQFIVIDCIATGAQYLNIQTHILLSY